MSIDAEVNKVKAAIQLASSLINMRKEGRLIRLHWSNDYQLKVDNCFDTWLKHRSRMADREMTPEMYQSYKESVLERYRTVGKPWGFWYGINESWLEYCIDNSVDSIRPYIYEVDLTPCHIYRLDSTLKYNRFMDEYRARQTRDIYRFESINWEKVYKDYDGIEIDQFVVERNHMNLWYHMLDRQGGCVWRFQGVRLYAVLEGDQYTIIDNGSKFW